jgi:pyruvyltransferase
VNLYWWISKSGKRNLGDEITCQILEKKFGCNVKRADIYDADVISAGSILGWIYESKSPAMLKRSKELTVLGSGFMHPWVAVEKKNYIDFSMVRGYLTKNILGSEVNKDLAVGDPGILFSEVVELKKSVRKKYKFGIIPHMGSFGIKGFFERFSQLDSSVYIDFRTSDASEVARVMQECEVILSQSLHGLIFSDSLSIPNVWLDLGDLHVGGEFKFYDYFSTVNRPFYKKCGDGLLDGVGVNENVFIADQRVVDSLKNVVLDRFEDCVKRHGSAS